MSNDSSITVRLDSRLIELPAGCTLAGLVVSLGHEPRSLSTAVNDTFVGRAQRSEHVLGDGDRVLFFQPVVGG